MLIFVNSKSIEEREKKELLDFSEKHFSQAKIRLPLAHCRCRSGSELICDEEDCSMFRNQTMYVILARHIEKFRIDSSMCAPLWTACNLHRCIFKRKRYASRDELPLTIWTHPTENSGETEWSDMLSSWVCALKLHVEKYSMIERFSSREKGLSH